MKNYKPKRTSVVLLKDNGVVFGSVQLNPRQRWEAEEDQQNGCVWLTRSGTRLRATPEQLEYSFEEV